MGSFRSFKHASCHGSPLYAKKTLKEEEGTSIDLDWDAAISFVSKCQNLPSHNTEKWVSQHKDDRGGFVYFPVVVWQVRLRMKMDR